MAYSKTTWTDRAVQFPRRYRDELNNQKTFTPDEGTVTSVGTAITAAAMNKIEQGVYNAHSQIMLQDSIQGTTQNITFTSGKPTKIEHKDTGNNILRTDTFDYSVSKLITEVRTLSTGETITYKYHLDTLQTEVI